MLVVPISSNINHEIQTNKIHSYEWDHQNSMENYFCQIALVFCGMCRIKVIIYSDEIKQKIDTKVGFC